MPRIPRAEIRKLKAPYVTQKRFDRAVDFCMHVINDPDAPLEAKLRLARAVLPFQTPKLAAAGTGRSMADVARWVDVHTAREAARSITGGGGSTTRKPRPRAGRHRRGEPPSHSSET